MLPEYAQVLWLPSSVSDVEMIHKFEWASLRG